MKISKKFKLGKTQEELDFVDIDTRRDLPVFLDPYFIGTRQDAWSTNAAKTIRSFFRFFISKIRANEHDQARELFDYLHEPNETCLGLSVGRPSGRGIGAREADKIFKSLKGSRAIATGLVENIEDCRIFIKGIDKDKISDMTTNVIRKSLIEYTQIQCKNLGIPLNPNTPSGIVWNREQKQWESFHTEMLVVEGKRILLIPKAVASFANRYTHQQYYQHFVLTFLQNEHLRMNSVLVRHKKRRDGSIKSWVAKKDIKKHEAPLDKDYLVQFTENHPEVFKEFYKNTKERITSLDHQDFNDNVDIDQVVDFLIKKLDEIPPGKEFANEYHRLISGILSLVFYPDLICPEIETQLHQGRKRIDITFDNAAKEGFFYKVHTIHKTPAQYVIVECKNYSGDIQNPELDQLAGRFSWNRGKLGFVVCRSVKNMNEILKKCSDNYNDDRGIIIPIVDEDLKKALKQVRSGIKNVYEEPLGERLKQVIFG